MSEPTYTPYHPRWYRRRVSTWWWLGDWKYLRFILRELSSLAVAWFVLLTLLGVRAAAQSAAAYAGYLEWMRNPLLVALNVVAFFFLVFHTITWFQAAPQAMAVRIGGRRVPDWMIAAPNYAAWLVISGVVAWLLLRS